VHPTLDQLVCWLQVLRIAMVGKYTGLSDAYLSVIKALQVRLRASRTLANTVFINVMPCYQKSEYCKRLILDACAAARVPGVQPEAADRMGRCWAAREGGRGSRLCSARCCMGEAAGSAWRACAG
jgi:CTP synthase (UTP-ammonia lyase)